MEQSTDVVIVGGGIIGCSLAYALRKRGATVVVLDQGAIGAQSSSAASGLLAPLKPFAKREDAYTRFLLSCLALFPGVVHELEEVTGMCLEYALTGTLRLYAEKNRTRLERWVVQWQQAGFQMEVLSEQDLSRYQGGVCTKASLALYNPHEPQLNAIHFVRAYADAAQKIGVKFLPFEEVVSVEYRHSTVTGVRTVRGHLLPCHHLVLATGAWSAKFGVCLGLSLPITPVRGQNIAVQQPRVPIHHILFGRGIYLAPKQNGTITVGTIRDDAGFAVETTEHGRAWLYEMATSLVPSLATSSIESAWAGLLPRTPDTRPIMGGAPEWENVTLACGHNGLGLLLASRSHLLAEYISTGRLDESLLPFSLKRFLSY